MLAQLGHVGRKDGSHKGKTVLLWILGSVAGLALMNLSAIMLYPKTAKLSCQADTAVVMGAAQYNGVPSPAFQRRLDRALELYQTGCVVSIHVTGGKATGDAYSEGASGVSYLHDQGVPLSALSSETRSTTSYENLLLSEPLLETQMITIVTDDLHAFRSHQLAKRLGYKAEPAPVYAPYERVNYALSELLKMFAYYLGFIR